MNAPSPSGPAPVIQLDRLLRLADFLDTVPAKKFDFERWTHECGSPACAFGWATQMPEFQKLGLRLGPNGPSLVGDGFSGSWESACIAAKEIFGLNEDQTTHLFVPGDDVDNWLEAQEDQRQLDDNNRPMEWAVPRTVAAHIRAFVAAHESGNEDEAVP